MPSLLKHNENWAMIKPAHPIPKLAASIPSRKREARETGHRGDRHWLNSNSAGTRCLSALDCDRRRRLAHTGGDLLIAYAVDALPPGRKLHRRMGGVDLRILHRTAARFEFGWVL